MPGPQNLIPATGMTSEPDDLEKALQENLKIRRKLARKTWEVRERNAKDRVGYAFYYNVPCARRALDTPLALDALWRVFRSAEPWG
jgi:hypothetical protein